VDAEGKTLGRIATQIATILRGKHKAEYTPSVDVGDYVVVINAEKVRVNGNKAKGKIYYSHTGFVGGLKQLSFEQLVEKAPDSILEGVIAQSI
jgi:large subunit ribosomal protein L13